MSKAKYGLLQGLGQGLAQAGAFGLAMAEARQKQEWQEQFANREREHQDKVRGEDRTQRATERAEDRSYQDTVRTEDRTERGLLNAQAQNNWQAEQGMRRDEMGMRQEQLQASIRQIDQALELGQFSIDEAKQLNDIRTVIGSPDSSEEEVNQAVQTFNNLKGGRPDRFSFHAIPELDAMGDRVGTSLLTHNSSTNEIRPYNSGPNIPQEAISILQSDPSPKAIAEFDDIFGIGAASRVLRRN